MARRSSTAEPKPAVKPRPTGDTYPCDCGAYFEQTGASWVYLRGSFRGSGEEAAKHRDEHPRDWTVMLAVACSCGGRAFVASEAATSISGRRVEKGEIIPTGTVPPDAVPIHERRTDPLMAFHGDKHRHSAYQKARAQLVHDTIRHHWTRQQVADRLVDMADTFPEKAAVLVSEAGALAGG